MRIISGKARGSNLFSPEGLDTRPTLDRVREAIFSMIFTRTDDARVLDLFAGSGAMGLEALSRGASEVDFVDVSPKACECIRKNLDKTRLTGGRITNCDFKTFLARCNGAYDIIFLDPPYEAGYYTETLDIIKKRELLAEDGIIIAECNDAEGFDSRGFAIDRQKKYGKVSVYLLIHSHGEDSL